jgi:hypothetical protein
MPRRNWCGYSRATGVGRCAVPTGTTSQRRLTICSTPWRLSGICLQCDSPKHRCNADGHEAYGDEMPRHPFNEMCPVCFFSNHLRPRRESFGNKTSFQSKFETTGVEFIDVDPSSADGHRRRRERSYEHRQLTRRDRAPKIVSRSLPADDPRQRQPDIAKAPPSIRAVDVIPPLTHRPAGIDAAILAIG